MYLDLNLTVCIDMPEMKMSPKYASLNGFTSRVDHCLITANLGQNVLACSTTDNVLFSDHVPIKNKVEIQM